MTQTTRQTLTRAETAKVFALYYGSENNPLWMFLHTRTGYKYANKLCLTPLSKITDAQKISLLKAYGQTEKEAIELLTRITLHDIEMALQSSSRAFQEALSLSIAVSLWFGVGHWANGKNAIELGIAIERETIS